MLNLSGILKKDTNRRYKYLIDYFVTTRLLQTHCLRYMLKRRFENESGVCPSSMENTFHHVADLNKLVQP